MMFYLPFCILRKDLNLALDLSQQQSKYFGAPASEQFLYHADTGESRDQLQAP